MIKSIFLLTILHAALSLPAPGVISTWAFRENVTWKYSHCSSFVRLPSDVILAVFQASQSTEGASTQEKFLVRSTDGGATFSPPSVLVANTTGDLLPWDGTMFIDTTGRVRYVYAGGDKFHIPAGPLFTISSTDEGISWSAPTLVVPISVWNRSMSNINPPVRLRDGTLALPVDTVPGVSSENGPVTSGLIVVGGDGELWSPLGFVPSPELAQISTFLEPAVAKCPPPLDNQLLMLLRTNIGQLWASRSTDSGATWSTAYETPFRNPDSKVNLFQWSGPSAGGNAPRDGDFVLLLNPNAEWGPKGCNATQPYCARTPLSLTVSRDCGGSWGSLYDIEIDANDHWGFGYPTAQQCNSSAVTGASAICLTYSVSTNGTVPGGIRYSIVPATNLI